MKLITSREIRKAQEMRPLAWFEGIDKVTDTMKQCFEIGSVRYWKKAKSYVIHDSYYGTNWIITKDFYDKA